jgi:hypothetical protein
MDSSKLNLVINIIRTNITEDMTATGGSLAGLPPEEPPVDLRKTKFKKLPYFFRQLLRKK